MRWATLVERRFEVADAPSCGSAARTDFSGTDFGPVRRLGSRGPMEKVFSVRYILVAKKASSAPYGANASLVASLFSLSLVVFCKGAKQEADAKPQFANRAVQAPGFADFTA